MKYKMLNPDKYFFRKESTGTGKNKNKQKKRKQKTIKRRTKHNEKMKKKFD